MAKTVSQKTMVEAMRVLRERAAGGNVNPMELLYEHGFADWVVKHARGAYGWNWTEILIDMRNGRFFFNQNTYTSQNSITGDYLSKDDAQGMGEWLIQKLIALAVVLSPSEPLLRSLQWDGFDVNKDKLTLVPLE